MTRSPEQVYSELLVLRCLSGEQAALGQLVDLWQPRFNRQALHLCGDPQLAEEVLQECWLAISRSIRRLQDPASFPAWAWRILGNKAADAIRQRVRERSLAGEADPADQLAAPAPDGTELQLLQAAIRSLPAGQRELLRLHYLEGFALAEIARLLDIPAGTVKSRLHAARDALRQLISGNTDE